MNILYIDSTVRKGSRTSQLAEYLLGKLDGDITRVKLCKSELPKADSSFLEKRDRACASGDFSDNMFEPAKQFAAADIIVVAAPYWDLSFPAALKQYFEQINVIGLTFAYTEKGLPVGLCKAKKLFYVTTAGGRIISEEYGFGYVNALAKTFYGIEECTCIKAEGLDIYGADVKALVSSAKSEIDRYFTDVRSEFKK